MLNKLNVVMASCVAVALLVSIVTSAQASLNRQIGAVDLVSDADLRLDGAAVGDQAAASVADAGDVNGDGLTDVIIGAPNTDNSGRDNSGSAYVIFGVEDPDSPLDLNEIGSRGFRIDGAAAGDWAGVAVTGAGDVNGDGLADVVVGALYAGHNDRTRSGSAYVVFGKGSNDTVDLGDLGNQGFSVDGAEAYDQAGFTVVGVGDLNNDGLNDLAVGAPWANNSGIHPPFLGRSNAWSTYIVYGKPSVDAIDLGDLGNQGFRIDGGNAGDKSGTAISATGDVNGDGTPDLIVGARFALNSNRLMAGSAYVVFGDQSNDLVDLRFLGQRGFRIDGAHSYDVAGWSVAGVGDVNSDGLADVVIGAPHSDNNDRDNSGSVYVVYGKASSDALDLNELGNQGFSIDGASADDRAGSSVDEAGDVNSDGVPDLILGAPEADDNDRDNSGSVYVVFGDGDPSSQLDLSDIGNRGFSIEGAATNDAAGTSVASTGDTNGDGHSDLMIGAPGADNNGRDNSGSAYIVYGIEADGGPCRYPVPSVKRSTRSTKYPNATPVPSLLPELSAKSHAAYWPMSKP